MDTDGEGMGQRAQTGYLFIVNVLFRPALMVVGFLLGSMMVDIMTDYVMALFPIVIANASMNSWTGLIKIAAYVASFVIILQTVVNMSFQLIRFVPDQVLGWIGGNQVNNIGANAADEVGGAARAAMGGRGVVSGAFSNAKQAKQAKQAGDEKNKSSQDTMYADAHAENKQDSQHKDMMKALNPNASAISGLENKDDSKAGGAGDAAKGDGK